MSKFGDSEAEENSLDESLSDKSDGDEDDEVEEEDEGRPDDANDIINDEEEESGGDEEEAHHGHHHRKRRKGTTSKLNYHRHLANNRQAEMCFQLIRSFPPVFQMRPKSWTKKIGL